MAGKLRSSSQVTVEARPGPQLVPARLSYPKIYRFDCDDFLVAQQLYIPLRFFFFFSCPSMVCGRQDCGSCGGQWGAEGSREGWGAPGSPQTKSKLKIQTKPNHTKFNQTKLKPTKSN